LRPGARFEAVEQQAGEPFAEAIRVRKQCADADRSAIRRPCGSADLRARPGGGAAAAVAGLDAYGPKLAPIAEVGNLRPIARPRRARDGDALTGHLCVLVRAQVANPQLHAAAAIAGEGDRGAVG